MPINTLCPFRVGDAVVLARNAVKYLGVTLDNKLTFREHLRTVTDKAVNVTSALSRLMANTPAHSIARGAYSCVPPKPSCFTERKSGSERCGKSAPQEFCRSPTERGALDSDAR